MELKVFDRELTPLGIVDEVDSLIWSGTYWQQGDYGDVKILAPVTDNNSELLVKGSILVKHGDKPEYTDADGGIWRRAMQITYRNITKDENEVEQIEVQGCCIKKWLSKRVIVKQIITNATNQAIINKIVRENMGADATTLRKFQQFTLLAQETIAGSAVEYSNQAYIDCGIEIYNRALLGKLGYDILVNENSKQYGFYLYKGKDLTATNTDQNTPCIFSRDFDNVNELEYTESIENMKNAIYVTGAADESNVATTIEVYDESITGLDRDEVYIEASDISWKATDDSGQEITIPLATYLELLHTRGETELESYGEVINFVATINTSSNLQYMEDFNIGDTITCVEKEWGIKIDARITKVTQTFQDGKQTIEATFGESLPTLIEKIRKAR